MAKCIETANLTKFYGKARGITDINLTVEEGEIFGFIGPNGAGKSTTIRSLLGLITQRQEWPVYLIWRQGQIGLRFLMTLDICLLRQCSIMECVSRRLLNTLPTYIRWIVAVKQIYYVIDLNLT